MKIHELAAERDELERSLRRALVAAGAFPGPIRVDQLASALPEGAVAAGFVETPGWRQDGDSGEILARDRVAGGPCAHRRRRVVPRWSLERRESWRHSSKPGAARSARRTAGESVKQPEDLRRSKD